MAVLWISVNLLTLTVFDWVAGDFSALILLSYVSPELV